MYTLVAFVIQPYGPNFIEHPGGGQGYEGAVKMLSSSTAETTARLTMNPAAVMWVLMVVPANLLRNGVTLVQDKFLKS